MNIDQVMPWIGLASSIAIGAGIVLVTKSRVDRIEQDVRDLHDEKASKEAVDSLRSVIADLRLDLDRRFDRLEGLLLRTRDERGAE